MKTLKQISELFKLFVTNHPQLKSYYFDNIDNITTGTIIYPTLWCSATTSQIKSLSFDIYICDILAHDRSNLIDAMSQMNSIVYDFTKHLEDDVYINFTPNSFSLKPFEGMFDDNAVGFTLSITLDYINPQIC
jgi:hypothetical protein